MVFSIIVIQITIIHIELYIILFRSINWITHVLIFPLKYKTRVRILNNKNINTEKLHNYEE